MPLDQVETLGEQLSNTLDAQFKPLQISLKRPDDSLLSSYALIHDYAPYIALEIEPITSEPSLNYFHFYEQIKAPIERLQRTQDLAELCETAVAEVQQITGFDRVMVYRFHSDGSGSVIAESA
ncbi:MAG: GAF domain-containing protein [Acaryochloridaceae cyanobacterium RL_2_7]|nr:GAF domain-containing protein [Acaryochloridaceae cyanobacterium RL_2_7]